jgi:excisionase family DNA binding protein
MTITTLPEKELLRPAKVAKLLDVSLSVIYYWIATGQLEAVKPAGKTLRILRSVVDEKIKSTLE